MNQLSKKNRFMKRRIHWLLVLICLVTIFHFSSQTQDEQRLTAFKQYVPIEKVEQWFSNVEFSYGGDTVSIEKRGPYGFVKFFVRKAAHFTIYFILGFLLTNALARTKIRTWMIICITFLLVSIWAAADEFHQGFVPSRTPSFEDLVIDIIGGLVGIILAILILKIRKSMWLRKQRLNKLDNSYK